MALYIFPGSGVKLYRCVFAHFTEKIAQRIISIFNGRSLRLPKGSPFRNPQKPIQEKPKKTNPPKKKELTKTIFRESWKFSGNFPRVPKSCCFWFLCFFFFGFGIFGFSWIGFAGIWRLASFLCYTTVEFISLIELSMFRNFYCSWQLMPNFLGLVLVFCFLFA